MRLAHGLHPAISTTPTVLTIGAFDGVHRGHQHLISQTVAHAQAAGMHSAVLTFEPHPDLVIHPDRERLYLASLTDRAQRIAELGVDLMIVEPFTAQLMGLSAQQFIELLCHSFPLRRLVIGWDFALGRKREGNLAKLQELGIDYGYDVIPVEPLRINNELVSSTRIRAALAAGDLDTTTHLLGRPFSLSGMVVEGDKRGRTIGYPTANLAISSQYALPADGVYICQAIVQGQVYGAVTNVGVRPTFAGQIRKIEAHLFDYSGDLYNTTITLTFLQRLRGEQRFNTIADLINQIEQDATHARQWLAKYHIKGQSNED